ncbi:MAG TPA: thiamine phosphate synthase [Verrucomicrobiota bacterium]|jgi:thiamine-phosphate pyrophosphorylase|nr:thiamine phosphate synthase [Verrucomicrobiota bacterium]HRR63424.1 thiamine phosphate synthase [Candidatus Paceibacterota bacterium]NLH85602.1 thiamine phosphate synthase [Verrucomicrobiota bacterium]HNR69982.1 thiamine phosphate synthase [Verrucomicrobiota bacterium]HNS68627.1 thiamine phosphate synthase [Verrucomicrobiota bacterium]
MKSLTECRLYAFVDTAFLQGRAPGEVARALCDGGADLIQLRAKEAPEAEVWRLAEAILPVTQRAGIGLVINDYPAIARELGAEFCHLGQEDFFGAGYTQVSQLPLAAEPEKPPAGEGGGCRPRVRVGLSSASPDQARRAIAAGADYLGVGPVFPTGTKPTARAVTLEYVRWAAANIPAPWFAIGGINLENVDEVLAAGARRICVVSAILAAPDPAAACRKFQQRLGRAARQG